MASIIDKQRFKQIPAYLLAAQFLLGGIVRASPVPFREAHAEVSRKNQRVAPLLYPFVPFADVQRHNIWISGCMLATSGLLFHPYTRGGPYTLCLVWYLTAGLAYSHQKLGLSYALPVANAGIALWNWLLYADKL